MKKTLCLVLCLLMCLSVLASCSGLKDDEKGASINVFLSEFPSTLDPAVVQLNADVEQLLYMIYEPLTYIDEDGKVAPALAEEWYYQYDDIYQKHQMHFILKESSWSDKRAVSADDVIYAWRRILSPEMDSPYASILYIIEGAREVKSGVGTIDDLGLEAWDDTHLVVTFESKYFEGDAEAKAELFAEQVANVHLAPCREDIVTRCEKEGVDWAASATDIVCNGKFRVQTMDMPRKKTSEDIGDSDEFTCKLVLERNAYYMRDVEKDKLDKYVTPYRINCYFAEGLAEYYADEQGLTQAQFQANRFTTGESYFLSYFDKNTYSTFLNNKDYNFETQQTLNGFAFYFNTENEILSDANVRKALSTALDRNTIVNEVTGTGEVAATGYVPAGVFDVDRKSDFREAGGNLYNTSSDMAAAKELAGKAKGKLTVNYLVPQNKEVVKESNRYVDLVDYSQNVYQAIAEKAAEYWEELGFTVECEGLHPDEYIEALINRDYDIIGINIVNGSTDAFSYLAPFAKEFSGAGVGDIDEESIDVDEEIFNTHYTNLDSEEYSTLIDDVLKASNRSDRAAKLHEVENKLVDLCPATMVFWYSRSFVASDEISKYKTDSWFGYVDMTKMKLKDWREVNAKEEEIRLAREGE